MSPKIKAEQVKRDNSNIWQYSRKLADALKQEDSNKKVDRCLIYYATLEQVEDMVSFSPYEALDTRMDLEKFYNTLVVGSKERDIFSLFIQGFSYKEIAEELGYSRHVYILVDELLARYKQFYEENNCE